MNSKAAKISTGDTSINMYIYVGKGDMTKEWQRQQGMKLCGLTTKLPRETHPHHDHHHMQGL
jgi:hypothetical protein